MQLDMPTLPLPHSLQPSPVSQHRQVSSAPQTASLTPSVPCLSSQLLAPFNDENWPNSRMQPCQPKQQFRNPEEVLTRIDMNEPQYFDGADKGPPSMFGNTFAADKGPPSMFGNTFAAPSMLQNSQPCSVVVPAYSSKTRLRDFSYEPPRSRAPLTYYYPVRSRSSTPRRRDSPTPRYLNAVKNSYGHVTGAQVPTTAPQLGQGTMAPATQLTSLAPGAGCPSSCGPTMPTGPVYQTSMAPVYSKTTMAPGPNSQTLLHHIKQVPTPCKYRSQMVSMIPTTLAPSGSYMSSKDSAPNSLCSTVNRTNQAGKSAAAPVPGQSAHSLLGPARQQSTDLVQTIQLTQTELQERMTKQQQQQHLQDKEQELQLTKVSLEERDREVARLEKELLEKEGELNDVRQRSDEQAGRREEDIADRDKTILHLQAKVEYLEHENASKDDWCRKRDEAARKLEGTLRTKESSFEAQLARKDQELEAKIQDIRGLEAKVRNLEDQVLFDRRQVEEIKSAHHALYQEKATRERELQEKSEELTKFLLELDAKSAGDVPSAIKGSCEAFEDAENSRLKEQLAKSEADLLMLQQWHAQMA